MVWNIPLASSLSVDLFLYNTVTATMTKDHNQKPKCTTFCPVLALKMTADPDYFSPGCIWNISICFMLTWANAGYLSKLYICVCLCVCACAWTYVHIFLFGPINPISNEHILTPSSDFACNKPHSFTAVQILRYFYAAPPEKYIPTHFVKISTATMKMFHCIIKRCLKCVVIHHRLPIQDKTIVWFTESKFYQSGCPLS